MKRKSIRILIALFFIQIIVMIAWYNVRKPRILVLHSYFTDYSWVRDVNAGINGVLGGRNDILLRWHYLDTKRRPWIEYRKNAGNVARRLVREWKPDVIVAVDDEAQEYAAKHFIDDPRMKIVFCGVNADPARHGYGGARNVTGILERLPLGAVREGLMSCLGRGRGNGPLRVTYLGDDSETAEGDEKQCRAFDWSPVVFAGSRRVGRFDAWKAAIREPGADVVIVSSYRSLLRSRGSRDRDHVPSGEVMEWTEKHSPVPVIGMDVSVVEDGGMLAIAASPAEQGEAAARMAVDIIDSGKDPKTIPVAETSRFVVAMRKSRIDARRFRVPGIYEEFSRAGNRYRR